MATEDYDDTDEFDDLDDLGPLPEPKCLKIVAEREALVEQGDFVKLYDSLLEVGWHETDLSKAFSQLLRAIDVASQKSPREFSDDLFRTMLNATAFILLRTQYTLIRQSRQADKQCRVRDLDFATEFLRSHMQNLFAIQAHAADLCHAQATTARAWQLAEQKRLENDRHRGVAPPAQGKHGSNPGQNGHAKTNGKANGAANYPRSPNGSKFRHRITTPRREGRTNGRGQNRNGQGTGSTLAKG